MEIGDKVILRCSGDTWLDGRQGVIRSGPLPASHPVLVGQAPFRNVWVQDDTRLPHLDQMFCISEQDLELV